MKWPTFAFFALALFSPAAQADDGRVLLHLELADDARLFTPAGTPLCRGSCVVRVAPGMYVVRRRSRAVELGITGTPGQELWIRAVLDDDRAFVAGVWPDEVPSDDALFLHLEEPPDATLSSWRGAELCRGSCVVRVNAGPYVVRRGDRRLPFAVAGAPRQHVHYRASFPNDGATIGGVIALGLGTISAGAGGAFLLSSTLRGVGAPHDCPSRYDGASEAEVTACGEAASADHARSHRKADAERAAGHAFLITGAVLGAAGLVLLIAGAASGRTRVRLQDEVAVAPGGVALRW